jgi:hypothetical protein
MGADVWGLFPWFEEHGREEIHPDDYDAVKALWPYCKVLQCVGNEDDYLRLRYGDLIVRVKPSLFSPVQSPAHDFGDPIRVIKSGEITSGNICGIFWHFKEGRPMYLIAVAGKRLKKRYWDEDFIEP